MRNHRLILSLILCALLLLSACRSKALEEEVRPADPAESSAEQAEPQEPEAQKEEEIPQRIVPFYLPENSCSYSGALAQQALDLCGGHTADRTAELFQNYGFEVCGQYHYDKPDEDQSHTCAYTIGRRTVEREGKTESLVIMAVRGTNAGEWYSNFDVAPSRDYSEVYAENFLLCAKEALSALQPELQGDELVLVCGHSRGGACANLLGVLLQDIVPEENLYVYTFASPTTVTAEAEIEVNNIFNVINPDDVVPMVPLTGWGFRRAGEDILLPGNETHAMQLEDAMMLLHSTAFTLEQYYEEKHSLTGPGLDPEHGLSTFDLMRFVAASFAGENRGAAGSSGVMQNIAPDSDLAPVLMLLGGLDTETTMQHMPMTYQLRLTVLGVQQLEE